MSIGHYYYKTDAFRAATGRLLQILTDYPNYTKMDKVYFLLGDSYYKWGRIDQSKPYFSKLITDYPQSKYAKKATKIMNKIEAQKIKNLD